MDWRQEILDALNFHDPGLSPEVLHDPVILHPVQT